MLVGWNEAPNVYQHSDARIQDLYNKKIDAGLVTYAAGPTKTSTREDKELSNMMSFSVTGSTGSTLINALKNTPDFRPAKFVDYCRCLFCRCRLKNLFASESK